MSKKILVIDDDEAIRKSFELALEDTRLQVRTAESGARGIEMEQAHPSDLIFLDLKMPGLNGVQTLLELRRLRSGVPIYIITAFHAEFFDELKQAEEDGIDFEVLRKPISSEQIELVTQSVLEQPKAY
jgi:CheY-like chemotaxis protein